MATDNNNHCEDIPSRANVEDTPELVAYYGELEQFQAGALWTIANQIEPWEPHSASMKHYKHTRRAPTDLTLMAY